VSKVTPIRQGSRDQLIIASYNVHSCVGMDRRRKPARVADVIRELKCDILALQEVDNQPGPEVESMQLEYLSEALEMAAVPGLRMIRKTGEYGNAILSRFPILAVRRHDLSYPLCEPRGALDVHLEVGDRPVRVIAAHLGLRRSERSFQWSRVLEVVTREIDMPTFVMGDMNEWYRGAKTLKEAHRIFGEPPAPPAFPSFFPLLALTRIWVRPVDAVRSIDVHRTDLARIASDHLPVKAVIDVRRLPRATGYVDGLARVMG
jgi:endonuclease/exonuclease/phosphatase family metal-dependent hydrolase